MFKQVFYRLIWVFFLALNLLASNYARAGVVPNYVYHAILGPAVPDLSTLKHLRFLTTDDFFPFNYRPKQGLPLVGYNVDLMRAICSELNVLPKCEVEPISFDKLLDNLRQGEGDAILAGLSEDAPQLGNDISFSKPYMLFPARFLTLTRLVDKNSGLAGGRAIVKQHVGVLQNSKHLSMLLLYFPHINYTSFANQKDMLTALQKGKIDAIFGDGRRLAALSGDYSFEGEAYYNQKFLGSGMRVAVLSKRQDILDAINYAIERLAKTGELYKIYLRYFPRDFY